MLRVQAGEGERAALDCLATGSLPLHVWWEREVRRRSVRGRRGERGRRVERGERHSILYNGTLLIYNVLPSDHGFYTCHAQNRAGQTIGQRLLAVVSTATTSSPEQTGEPESQ